MICMLAAAAAALSIQSQPDPILLDWIQYEQNGGSCLNPTDQLEKKCIGESLIGFLLSHVG